MHVTGLAVLIIVSVNFTKATELFQLGLSIAKNTGNTDAEGIIYNKLGAAYYFLGEFEKAMELSQLGLSILKNTGNKDAEGAVYNVTALALPITLSVNSRKQLSFFSGV